MNYKLANTEDLVMEMMNYINSHEIIAYDVESTGLNVRKSRIIGFAVTGSIGEGYYFPIFQWDIDKQELVDIIISGIKAKNMAPLILSLLIGKKLIMHNGSYDIQITKNDLKVDLLSYFYIDTMLLVHTVREEGLFALKDIAISIQEQIGFDIESAANEEQIALKENVKKNGGEVTKTNFELYKGDLEVIWPYAVKDVDLTLRVYEHYLLKLKQEGLESFFFDEEVMPLLREVTIPMEMAGVRLDIPLIEKNQLEISKDLEAYEQLVIDALRPLPEFRKWVMDKALETFPPSNKGNYAQAVVKHYNLTLPTSEKTGKYSITKKTVDALEESPIKQFLIDGNIDNLPAKDGVIISVNLWKEKEGGLVNIKSKQQLGDIAFNYFGIKPITFTEKGSGQFDDDFIEHLKSKGYEWANNLSIYNKLVKIKTSYIDRFLDNQEDGRYYFYYKQHGTISGRYSSDAQQLPRPLEDGELDAAVLKYRNEIRAFFIPDDGYYFIDSDYESLEPKCFSHVAQDQGLIDIFLKGHDFYSTIAIKTEKMQDVSADKQAENYLGKVNKPARQRSKSYALGIPYGMKAFALGQSIGVSTREAGELIEGYLDGFPNLRKWMDESERLVKEFGCIKTQVGRVRHLNKFKDVHDTFGDDITDWKYRKELESEFGVEEVRGMFLDYINGLNNARNFQIQSLAASIVNRAAIAINRKFKKLGIDGLVVAQIHDQIIIHVKDDERLKEATEIVQDLMENTTKLSLPLTAPPAIAKNFRDGH